MPRSKSKSSTKVMTVQAVKDIVREEMKETQEEKIAVIGEANTTVDTPNIPSGDVSASSNFVRLFPNISQGTGQYNRRVGNEIRLRELSIEMLLSYATQTGQNNYRDQAIGVRVMILRQKDNNDYNGFVEDAQTSKLLENGSIVSPGPSNFSGTTINLCQKINREQFSVKYDKVHYMERAREFSSDSTTRQFYTPPRPKFVKKRLTFGKKGLKLTFGDSSSESPTGFPYLLVIGYASSIDSGSASNNLIEYTYSAKAKFTDA